MGLSRHRFWYQHLRVCLCLGILLGPRPIFWYQHWQLGKECVVIPLIRVCEALCTSHISFFLSENVLGLLFSDTMLVCALSAHPSIRSLLRGFVKIHLLFSELSPQRHAPWRLRPPR